MTRIFKHLSLGLLIAIGAGQTHAQGPSNGPIESRLEAKKVIRASDGRESLVAADVVKPGDLIEYVATYRNTSREPVRNLEATLPIPPHTELVAGSARPANAKASVDARAFGDVPLTRPTQRDGRARNENIPYREYRYLRWYPGVLAGETSVTFVARVRVVE